MSSLSAIPLSYETPPFPSLYWPFKTSPNEPKYLYTLIDIWKFTLYWTLITIPLAHIIVALWAVFMQFLAANDRAKYLKQHTAGGNGAGSIEDQSDSEEYQSAHEHEQETNQTDGGTKEEPTKDQRPRRHKKVQKRRILSAKNRKLIGQSPFKDSLKYAVLIMSVYVIVGSIEAFIAGSLVGVVLGAVYNAGFFRMSVWTPLFWGIINMLVLILSSFRISGGM